MKKIRNVYHKVDPKIAEKVLLANQQEYDNNIPSYLEDIFLAHPTHFTYKIQRKRILKLLKDFPGSKKIRVLDVAAGPGPYSNILLEDPRVEIHALDISSSQLKIYKKKNPKRIKIYVNDVAVFLSENSKLHFDFVLVGSCLHHFPDYKLVMNLIMKKCDAEVVYISREPVVVHKPFGFIFLQYINDCFAVPHHYYHKKTIPLYKRVIMVTGSWFMMPILRMIEPYGYNPINFLRRKKAKSFANFTEFHKAIDFDSIRKSFKKYGYVTKVYPSPLYFYEWIFKLAQKWNLPNEDECMVAIKNRNGKIVFPKE